jgi:protein-disulfide isomerase
VGGAERSARRRRQAQTAGKSPASGKAPAVASHKSGGRRNVVIGVVVVVLLLGAVLAGVIYTTNEKNATEGQDIAANSTSELDDAASGAAGGNADYPVKREGAVVVVGEDSAKVTLDVYEDFLCPVCRQFEAEYGADFAKHVTDGTLKLRYHMLPMLNDRSDPPGYSMDSANAGLCAADAGKFPGFHVSLFDAQPEEGARGWDKQQLAKLGKDLGITSPTFKSCVEGGKYDSALQAELDKVRTAEYLQQEIDGQKGFGTPTVAKGQQVVDTADPKWLEKLL